MIENLLYEKGYSSILSITDNNPEKEKEQLNILKDKLIDGFIVIPGSNTQYEKMFSDEKVIAIDTKMNIANETCIKSNNYLGIKLAMDLLLEQGHRKIGIVNIPMFSQNGIERLDAFKAICLKEKIILKDTYIKYTEIKDYSELGKEMIENSYAQTIVLMSQEDRPTAVISTGIYVSIGMLRAFTKLNTSIPEDISFISFDELYKYSDLFKTSITTIKQPVKEISVNAVELLLKKIENEEVLPGIIEIEPQLVMGDSCMSVKV
jgi:LacI family transcriptional regulator